jgi:hypothetical protein
MRARPFQEFALVGRSKVDLTVSFRSDESDCADLAKVTKKKEEVEIRKAHHESTSAPQVILVIFSLSLSFL